MDAGKWTTQKNSNISSFFIREHLSFIDEAARGTLLKFIKSLKKIFKKKKKKVFSISVTATAPSNGS